MKKILITGGAGYIGGYLTDLLLKDDFDVTVLDNLFFESRYLKDVNFIFGDVNDKKLIEQVLKKNFDIVICLAAIVGDPASKKFPKLTNITNLVSSKKLFNFRNDVF